MAGVGAGVAVGLQQQVGSGGSAVPANARLVASGGEERVITPGGEARVYG